MTQSTALFALLLLVTLQAPALHAQEATPSTEETQRTQESADTDTPKDTAPAPQEAEATPGGSSQPSPFDYRASEQISEDLSVSFPVDI